MAHFDSPVNDANSYDVCVNVCKVSSMYQT